MERNCFSFSASSKRAFGLSSAVKKSGSCPQGAYAKEKLKQGRTKRRQRANNGSVCVVSSFCHSIKNAFTVESNRDLNSPHIEDCKKESAFSQTARSASFISLIYSVLMHFTFGNYFCPHGVSVQTQFFSAAKNGIVFYGNRIRKKCVDVYFRRSGNIFLAFG